MSIKQYIPNMTETVKIVVIVVVLTVTGIGATLASKAGGLLKR